MRTQELVEPGGESGREVDVPVYCVRKEYSRRYVVPEGRYDDMFSRQQEGDRRTVGRGPTR